MSANGKAVIAFAGCLAGIGGMVSAMHSFAEFATPQGIGGLLLIVAAQITAIYAQPPTPKP